MNERADFGDACGRRWLSSQQQRGVESETARARQNEKAQADKSSEENEGHRHGVATGLQQRAYVFIEAGVVSFSNVDRGRKKAADGFGVPMHLSECGACELHGPRYRGFLETLGQHASWTNPELGLLEPSHIIWPGQRLSDTNEQKGSNCCSILPAKSVLSNVIRGNNFPTVSRN
jgi:hypothetical protein